MVSYLSAAQNNLLRFRMLQSLNCNYNLNSFILEPNVWQRVLTSCMNAVYQSNSSISLKCHGNLQACHPSVPFQKLSYLNMSVIMENYCHGWWDWQHIHFPISVYYWPSNPVLCQPAHCDSQHCKLPPPTPV